MGGVAAGGHRAVWLRAGERRVMSGLAAGIGRVSVGRATRRTERPRRRYTEEREYGDMGASVCTVSFARDLGATNG
jgi:hypothetical protein